MPETWRRLCEHLGDRIEEAASVLGPHLREPYTLRLQKITYEPLAVWISSGRRSIELRPGVGAGRQRVEIRANARGHSDEVRTLEIGSPGCAADDGLDALLWETILL